MAVKLQSQQAKSPPQTANCPPSTGALAWTALSDPRSLAPEGANRAPLMECHIPPPMAPIQKAPPTSSIIRHGQGSRSAIPDLPMMINNSGKDEVLEKLGKFLSEEKSMNTKTPVDETSQ